MKVIRRLSFDPGVNSSNILELFFFFFLYHCVNLYVYILCWCPPAGHLDVVRLLVNQGAEVSCKDKRGYTPLHTAASSGQITVIKHLLNLAVEVNTHTHTLRRRQTGRNSRCHGDHRLTNPTHLGTRRSTWPALMARTQSPASWLTAAPTSASPTTRDSLRCILLQPPHTEHSVWSSWSTTGLMSMCRYDRTVDNFVTDIVALQITMGLFLLVHELAQHWYMKTIQVQFPGPVLFVWVTCFHVFTWCVQVMSSLQLKKKKGPFCGFMDSSSELCKC